MAERSAFDDLADGLRRSESPAARFAAHCMWEVFRSGRFSFVAVNHDLTGNDSLSAVRLVALRDGNLLAFFVPVDQNPDVWRRDLETMVEKTESLPANLINLGDEDYWKVLQSKAFALARRFKFDTLAAMVMSREANGRVDLSVLFPKAFSRLISGSDDSVAYSVSMLFLKKAPFDKSFPIPDTF